MAIIKFVNKRPGLKKILKYVSQDKKAYKIEGKDCTPEFALLEMSYVKKFFNKTDGREFIHLIQSFSQDDNISPEKVHELGMKLAEYFNGFQVLVATHTDKAHIHSHLIINSVNFENGKKYHQSIDEMQRVKDYSNKLCLEAGLKIFTKKSKVKDISLNECKVMQKGASWKQKLINDIEIAMNYTNKKYEFINKMNELGYKVTWRKERKYITYTTPDGKKCRDFRLHNEEYLKLNMENYFKEKRRKNSIKKNMRRIIGFNIQPFYISEKASKYLGELSKQAKKEYAMKRVNASSIDWENEI